MAGGALAHDDRRRVGRQLRQEAAQQKLEAWAQPWLEAGPLASVKSAIKSARPALGGNGRNEARFRCDREQVFRMQERRIHQLFEISVLLKGAHALIECLAGVALALTNNQWIRDAVTKATQSELIEDKGDFVANHLVHWVHGFSIATQHFYSWYLLSHGAVKLALVVGLLLRKLWAYPTAIVIFGLFIAYQLYRYHETHGIGLLLLTALDLVVVGLTWHEYGLMRRHLPVE